MVAARQARVIGPGTTLSPTPTGVAPSARCTSRRGLKSRPAADDKRASGDETEPVVIAVAALAAIVGDNIGYALGRAV
jgi:hypothetical protein